MKNLLVLMGLLFTSVCVHANDGQNTQKIAVIKKLYDEHLKEKSKFNIHSLFSKDFNQATEHNAKAEKAADGIACLEYDYIIQGQDYDAKEIKRTLKTQVMPNGRVEVTFNNFGSKNTVHYVFSCNAQTCLIDDIIEPEELQGKPKSSFKQGLRQCLRKNFPKVSPPK